MPTIAEQISKKSTTPSSNIAEALEGYNGGGGSGSNTGGTLVVTVTDFEPMDDGISDMATMDKTYDEIKQHYQSGGRLVFKIVTDHSTHEEPICWQLDEENDKITFVSIERFAFNSGFDFTLESLVVSSDLVTRCVLRPMSTNLPNKNSSMA